MTLLDDEDPRLRFWGVTLLARFRGLATHQLAGLAGDVDPSVRAAVAETLGERRELANLPAVTALIDDSTWFVRAHAARSAAAIGGLGVAGRIVPLLGDRSAVKDHASHQHIM